VAVGGGSWWLGAAGVSKDGVCLARADSDNGWLFSGEGNGFFSVWICISLTFNSVSLQWANVIWTFRWLLARLGFLSLVGLCFIVLRGSNVCSCNVSLLYLIAVLSQVLS
jgi:hypothetical protein